MSSPGPTTDEEAIEWDPTPVNPTALPEPTPDAEEIEWDPTPPNPPVLPEPTTPPTLTRYEQRMKDIKEGLAGRPRVVNHPSARLLAIEEGLRSVDHAKRPASPPHLNPSKRPKPTITTTIQKICCAQRAMTEQNHRSDALSVTLTTEQTRILDMIAAGRSLFYTGSAGELSSPIHHLSSSFPF